MILNSSEVSSFAAAPLNSYTSTDFQEMQNLRNGPYQGRYKSFPVQTEDYFYSVVRYVERNALRANLVDRAESWRWSSLGCLDQKDSPAALLSAWPLPRPANWVEIVNEPQTEAELAALRRCVNRGTPYGDDGWIATMESCQNNLIRFS
jgi:hypothetical protein